ncbi:MAG: phosphatidate cytidylyltransferase [Ignavibacteriaceae bacterium]|jgi:phosphatidate cytidylyltransferase|nr:MAG: phosphatidate cytidylyltransferase [Chlorobiota bacterium]KXK06215.1 MAG: phosphatidate cytidylyltransferase [Chlorobi bacterium OLB4]MBV6399272.1 Phosphatidate cytidylyltransferase [Ignavibacteria bacterium]MCC6884945.1 phosphatidate cytidylyltransferase [Ignavibacteriales bacterium]MCE7953524.1 phosphatidate cytidylyltransferase [Chlorobi bacterium CHB7]MDL1887586.1 phosphatidate cytidylyltransferase [Ignavibacteria bacterium CHB1]MEB2329286.1 phosphatidate cytidylyltransferase [Ign
MSNNSIRILTGLVGIPLLVFIIVSEGFYYLGLTLIVSFFCLWEFHELFGKKGYGSRKIITIILSVLILLVSFMLPSWTKILFLVSVFVLISTEIFYKNRNPVSLFVSISGLLYITLPFVLTFELINMYDFKPVLLIFIMVWSCDTSAYFFGKKFGKHKVSDISPRKTWEGSIAGFVVSVIAALIYREFFPEWISFFDAIIIGVIGGIFSQIGDLFESMLKRYSGVKDSSELIPGHGGFLDRFDSFIFVAVPFFLYFAYIKPEI